MPTVKLIDLPRCAIHVAVPAAPAVVPAVPVDHVVHVVVPAALVAINDMALNRNVLLASVDRVINYFSYIYLRNKI